MGKGGGGGGTQQTTATTYQSNLPEYAEPYFKEIMARTQAESIQPYTAYTGDRVSDFSQNQQDVQAYAQGLDPSKSMASAENLYGQLATQTFDADTAKAGMDPYMQAVVDQQKQAILKDYNRQANVDAAQAVKAGAFGGGREGAERAVSQSEMLGRMADVQAQGLQQAYATSREQFNKMQEVQAQTAQAQQGLAAAQTALKNAVGAEEKQQAQAKLDQAYNDFVNARDFERQQIAFYNSVMRGIPVTAQQEVIQSAPGQSNVAQLAGLGLAGLGAYNKLG
jgi:hypothetical protein